VITTVEKKMVLKKMERLKNNDLAELRESLKVILEQD